MPGRMARCIRRGSRFSSSSGAIIFLDMKHVFDRMEPPGTLTCRPCSRSSPGWPAAMSAIPRPCFRCSAWGARPGRSTPSHSRTTPATANGAAPPSRRTRSRTCSRVSPSWGFCRAATRCCPAISARRMPGRCCSTSSAGSNRPTRGRCSPATRSWAMSGQAGMFAPAYRNSTATVRSQWPTS